MFGNMIFANGLFANTDADIFEGLVWIDECPAQTDWNDNSTSEIITRTCGENT